MAVSSVPTVSGVTNRCKQFQRIGRRTRLRNRSLASLLSQPCVRQPMQPEVMSRCSTDKNVEYHETLSWHERQPLNPQREQICAPYKRAEYHETLSWHERQPLDPQREQSCALSESQSMWNVVRAAETCQLAFLATEGRKHENH